MISVMTTLILILTASLVLIVWSLGSTLRDGQGSARPPRSHYEDPTFLSPARRTVTHDEGPVP